MQQDTPDQQVDGAAEELRVRILDSLGLSLATKRKEAVDAKAASGIENEWTGDEEFYQGYDDANRHEFENTASKPSTTGGTKEPVSRKTGSTIFPNITQPYVDAVAARVGDMLLPTDDRNYALEHTKIPDMLEGPPEVEQAAPNMDPSGAQVPEPVLSAIEKAKQEFTRYKAEAARRADKAEDRIDDWLQECQYHAELRKVIDETTKLGSGVIKGPVPVKRKTSVWQKGKDGISALVMVEEIKPASFRVDPWNLFPAPGCGESIHNGSHIFERDALTEKKLEDLIGLPGYIESQIEACIKEGPKSRTANSRNIGERDAKDLYDVWYFHGSISTEELMAAGCDCGPEEGRKRSYPAMLTMVNDRVIRASLNPLDSGEFPYDVIPWKRRPGMPWGMGLARQLRTPQRIVVGAARQLMNNAGLAGGPQLVIRRSVQPENGVWEVAPLKMWVEDDDATGNASAPVSAVTIPMMLAELTALVQLGMKMAEDTTGMPMLMQGQQGSAPDTVGGMTILNNNANSVLRRIARLFDSCVTEPHIRRYYAWLMEYGEDEDEKGDFNIVARGSTALVERDLQSQEMVNVLNLCLNPAFKKNPAKAMDEYLKSRRFDPAAFDYTEEELKQMQSQQAPPDPRLEVAKMAAKSKEDALMASTQVRMEELKIQNENDDLDRALLEKEITGRLASEVDALKAKLALKTMELQVQQSENQLARAQADDHVVAGHRMGAFNQERKQIARTTVEPAGKAPPGESFAL